MSENLETLQEVDLLLAQMHDEASESVEKAYEDFLLALRLGWDDAGDFETRYRTRWMYAQGIFDARVEIRNKLYLAKVE